jgi:DHA2 family multidrug resistance protein
MNAHLNHDYGYYEFRWSQLVRALGQPLIMTPLTNTAYEGVAHEDVPSASGLYNMLRNLGGSVGISLLSTLITDRYRLHFLRLGSSLEIIRPEVQGFLRETGRLLGHGTGGRHGDRPIQVLGGLLNREANVLAFADAFAVMALVMTVACLGVFFMKKAHETEMAEGAH